MKAKAIVYTSNTGYTAEYAHLLGERTFLPVYTLEEAKRSLPKDTEIVYLGWLMASMVKGYGEAAKHFKIALVCGVCLGTSGSQIDEVRRVNKLPTSLPLFTLQGGFDMARLRGIYKLMMRMMRKILVKQIVQKSEQTEDDMKILRLLQNGGSAVDGRYLDEVIENLKQ